MARPRTISYQPDEMIKLGEEMIEWVKQNDPIHLSQWYSCVKLIDDNDWRNMIECGEFSPYYRRALKMVGYKYLTKDSPIDNGIKQRWQRVYFKDLKHEEDESLTFEAKLKAVSDLNASEQQKSNHQSIIDAIVASQSDRKIADKSNKADAISD